MKKILFAIACLTLFVGSVEAQSYKLPRDKVDNSKLSTTQRVDALDTRVDDIDERLKAVEKQLTPKVEKPATKADSTRKLAETSLRASDYGIRLNPGETLVAAPTIVSQSTPVVRFLPSTVPVTQTPIPPVRRILPAPKAWVPQQPSFRLLKTK